MIKSMTGFGRGSAGRGPNKIDVEIRAVNSRFLELKLRGFNLDPSMEQKVRNLAETNLQRGNVQIRIELKSLLVMISSAPPSNADSIIVSSSTSV